LEWCRDCAVLPQGMFGIRKGVPDKRKVVSDGITYYPQAYVLEFDPSGKPTHRAILHDLKANSVTTVLLKDVEKFKKQ